MAWIPTVTAKARDPLTFNIVPTITYANGGTTLVDPSPIRGVDLTDAQIAEHCRKRIKGVLNVGDVALAAITLGVVTLPPDPVADPKQQAIFDAQRAFDQATIDARVADLAAGAALKHPEVQIAYDALVAAQKA